MTDGPLDQSHPILWGPRRGESSLELFRSRDLGRFDRVTSSTFWEGSHVERLLEDSLQTRPVLLYLPSTELVSVSERFPDVLQLVLRELLALVEEEHYLESFFVGHVAFARPAPHDSVVTIVLVERPRRRNVHFL